MIMGPEISGGVVVDGSVVGPTGVVVDPPGAGVTESVGVVVDGPIGGVVVDSVGGIADESTGVETGGMGTSTVSVRTGVAVGTPVVSTPPPARLRTTAPPGSLIPTERCSPSAVSR